MGRGCGVLPQLTLIESRGAPYLRPARSQLPSSDGAEALECSPVLHTDIPHEQDQGCRDSGWSFPQWGGPNPYHGYQCELLPYVGEVTQRGNIVDTCSGDTVGHGHTITSKAGRQNLQTWSMIQRHHEVLSHPDDLMASDRRLFLKVSARYTFHNSYHHIILV